MDKIFKRTWVTFMVILMLIASAPIVNIAGVDLVITASAAKITSYSQGDIIEFGWYPQSEVTDSSIISALDSDSGEWLSYNYYSGTGNLSDGKMTASDYMRYKDVLYCSEKYRGVVFDSYRPYFTGYTSSNSYTYQDENGYKPNTVYWFKYEPIKWRVLDSAMGMVMSETILDSQPYNNYILSSGTDEYGYIAYWGDSSKTYYANNYAESSIRQWLNNDFYNTAFSKTQQNIIKSTTIDNSAYSNVCSAYDSEATNDKIYLLSQNDSIDTSYGFSNSYSEFDIERRAQGSDYAQSQGLWINTSASYYGNVLWLLRSPGNDSRGCRRVHDYGQLDYNYNVSNTDNGVRPALNFDLTAEIFQCDVKDTGNSSSNGADVDEEPEEPTTEEPITQVPDTDGVEKDCSCNCHKSGFLAFIWKILRFFYKLFKINPVCSCGIAHY